MWLSEATASRIYDIANVGLIVGLVLGAASTILVVWMGNVKEEYLRKQVATMEGVAATARERAASAELQLEKIKKPRFLRPEQQADIVAAAKPYAGMKFDAAVFSDMESRGFLAQLTMPLEAAGWKQVGWVGDGVLVYKAEGAPAIGITLLSAVYLQVGNNEFRP